MVSLIHEDVHKNTSNVEYGGYNVNVFFSMVNFNVVGVKEVCLEGELTLFKKELFNVTLKLMCLFNLIVFCMVRKCWRYVSNKKTKSLENIDDDAGMVSSYFFVAHGSNIPRRFTKFKIRFY